MFSGGVKWSICWKWVKEMLVPSLHYIAYLIWDKVFKNGPSKICGRQPLKNFSLTIPEYFVPFRDKEVSKEKFSKC